MEDLNENKDENTISDSHSAAEEKKDVSEPIAAGTADNEKQGKENEKEPIKEKKEKPKQAVKKMEPHPKTHSVRNRPQKPKRTTKSSNKKLPYIIGGIIIAAVVIFLVIRLNTPTGHAVDVGDPTQYGSVDATFYVMSQCPYGVQVENAIQPVLEELGGNINFSLEFIAVETPTGFNSLHGQPEVEGNIIQLCVQEHYPDELIDFVVCQNEDVQNLRGSVEKCAEKTGIDAEQVLACADSEEGRQLLSGSIKKSQAVNAQGSPTIYINGQQYAGARDAASFKKAVCAGLEGHPSCEDMPACSSDADCKEQPGKVGTCENAGTKDAKCIYSDDVAVTLTIINTEECTSCDTTQIKTVLGQMFQNMEVEEIDASSKKGKAFVDRFGLGHAPSYVFTGELDKTYAWQNNPRIRGAFKSVSGYFVMVDEASGATYVLDEKERQAREELTGVKKGDNRPQIDFYVMSYCPYGNMAEEAIEPVYQLLKGNADFNPHYVIYSNYQGGGPAYCLDDEDKYCSMHGVQELNQGLREFCVAKHLGMDEYFEFVLEMNSKCNYQNADSCWEGVAKSLKLDVEKVKDCEANEWEEILADELALNQALGVRGSPTVFVEGAAYSGARSAAGYAQSLCAGFDSAPDGCSASSLASLGSATPTPAASAGGCG